MTRVAVGMALLVMRAATLFGGAGTVYTEHSVYYTRHCWHKRSPSKNDTTEHSE